MSETISPPNSLLPWLNHQYSLVEKLQQTLGHAEVCKLYQAWEVTSGWEHVVLGIQDSSTFCREVMIYSQNKHRWYAKTLIPLSTYQQGEKLFKRLDNESLGQIIFSNPHIQRLSLVYYAISPQQEEYSWLDETFHQCAQTLWARMALLSVGEDALFYLFEIFSPDFLMDRLA